MPPLLALSGEHREPYFLDGSDQLDARTSQLFETEANYGAAKLLFQGEIFGTVAGSSTVGMATVVDLGMKFGASIHASFRNYVETSRDSIAGLVISRPWRTPDGDLMLPH